VPGIKQPVSEKTYIQWDELVSLCDTICNNINTDGVHIERIIGISRGGLIPATIIANCLGVREVYSFGVRSYPDDKYESSAGSPVTYQDMIHPGSTFLRETKSTLIVDDISDKGKTLHFVTSKIYNTKPGAANIVRTASLFIKKETTFIPDWYAMVSDKWIVFPWERK
jgi:uncharacterized protein